MLKEKTKADELSKEFKSVSVSEFFERNRHLLGYDNPSKALLTVIKEGVDNSIDACEEAKILPEIFVEIKQLEENKFKVIVNDNGPGIVKQYIPQVFAKLLYGSKFHRLRQSRGIQGIGISSAVLYAQLTTGKSAKIISKTSAKNPAYYYELHINTLKNEPEVIKEQIVEWKQDQGTQVELEIEAKYQQGQQSVDQYLQQTSITNPHVKITYISPKNEKTEFPRATKELPKEPKEIKPHPYGVELGILARMLKSTKARTLQSFLISDFSRVSVNTAKEICEKAKIYTNAKPSRIARQEVDNLMKSIKNTKIRAPPTDCLSPITAELLEKGLKKEITAEFYASTTRPPSVYRGNPFIIECSIAYGGNLEKDSSVKILRFANKVPLLYQKGACAITQSIAKTNWRSYGLNQSSNNIPIGPAAIVVHIASVWVPFTSEAKEAIAHYPEIIKEIKLALQEVGRKLGIYIRKKKKSEYESKKKSYIEKYIPHIGIALKEILDLKEKEEKKVVTVLKDILERSKK